MAEAASAEEPSWELRLHLLIEEHHQSLKSLAGLFVAGAVLQASKSLVGLFAAGAVPQAQYLGLPLEALMVVQTESAPSCTAPVLPVWHRLRLVTYLRFVLEVASDGPAQHLFVIGCERAGAAPSCVSSGYRL